MQNAKQKQNKQEQSLWIIYCKRVATYFINQTILIKCETSKTSFNRQYDAEYICSRISLLMYAATFLASLRILIYFFILPAE